MILKNMAFYHKVRNLSKITIIAILTIILIMYFITSTRSSHSQSSKPPRKDDNTRVTTKYQNTDSHMISMLDYEDHKQEGIHQNRIPISFSEKLPTARPAADQWNQETVSQGSAKNNILHFGKNKSVMKLAVVLCGDRLNQTMVTLKSAVALTTKPVHLIVMADEENRIPLSERLLDWPSSILSRISFEILPITFPEGKYAEEWKKLFKLCASQRLFFPDALPHVDSVLYVDTDVIFLRPIEDIWSFFEKMNSSHIAGLSPEHEDYSTGWYNRFARHPYYEPLGVNSGVMLMNLTRMRQFRWQEYLQPIFYEYKLKIVWGDQDIINIIFHYHPDKLYIFSCEWNYRPDHCMYTSVCKPAESEGVAFIHGNRGVFHNDKQPAFKAIYKVMEKYPLGSSLKENLLKPLKTALKETENTNCGRLHDILTKYLEKLIKLQSTSEQPSPQNPRNEKWEF